MNKLASTFYLDSLGLLFTNLHVIKYPNENDPETWKERIREVYDSDKWVIRCGELPDINGKPEKGLPWDFGKGLEKVTEKFMRIVESVRDDLCVFIHHQRNMAKGGVLLIKEDGSLIIEGVRGNSKYPTFKKLSDLTKGKINPDGTYYFDGLMHKRYKLGGKDIFTRDELVDIVRVSRVIDYELIGAVSRAIAIEFSVWPSGRVECHDIN